MVDHHRRTTVARFWVADGFTAGAVVTLGRDAAHHIRVLRLAAGAHVGLTDGAGLLGTGLLAHVERSSARVDVADVRTVPRATAVHMLVPVADRERLLWLAEKCTELQATSWRPVRWQRSASVSPRGSGAAFDARVKARMIAALTQSGGAWLPAVCGETSVDDVVREPPTGTRIVLDPSGPPLLRLGAERLTGPVAIAVGPEGGIEAIELARLADAGFERASLGDTILRFETAGIAALAVVRAAGGERPSAAREVKGESRKASG